MIRSTSPLAALRAIAIVLPLLPVLVCAIPQFPAISAGHLLRRDNCAVQCPGGLPTSFCCPTNTVCQSLAANSTGLCCPKGFDCSLIEPITCNLSLENMAVDPSAVIMTMALNSSLPTCGLNCCPFGYMCNTYEQCVRYNDQSSWPRAGTSSGGSSGAMPANIPGTPAANNGISVAVGVIAGVASLIALLAGGILYWRHKKGSALGRAAFAAATRSDNSNISGPMGDGGPMRHDFIHKRLNRVTSLFRRNSSGGTEQVRPTFAPSQNDEYSDGEEVDEKTGAPKQSPYRPYSTNQRGGDAPSEFDPYDRRFTNASNFTADMADEADHRGQVPPVPQMPPQSAWNKLMRR